LIENKFSSFMAVMPIIAYPASTTNRAIAFLLAGCARPDGGQMQKD
jgi:hypothetical protein